ncbi:MAG: omega-amidase [Clostridia bacterium]|nr:omega-amidase [Clostridia bacterium]
MAIFKAAVCQMLTGEDKKENLRRAESMVLEAARAGARLVVLPEMFNCPYRTRTFPDYAETYPDGPTLQMLARLAGENGIYLVGGSIPERAGGGRVFNTSFIFGPQGELLGRHRKLHLFDVELANGLRIQESSTLSYGQQVTVIPTAMCLIGIAICYDIRFPELARLMVLKGARVVVVPAAFNTTTGPAHWELTFRLRAVDNQAYFIAASPARNVGQGYPIYGHSLVVDPWGEVVAAAGEGEELILADIDLERVERVRRELPLLAHRRTDVYRLEEVPTGPETTP